jgi:hypothetical protein
MGGQGELLAYGEGEAVVINLKEWARSEIARLKAKRYANWGRGSGKSWAQWQQLKQQIEKGRQV